MLRNRAILIAVVVLLFIQWNRDRTPDAPPNAKIDRVTYVYEQTENSVPAEVLVALKQLNEKDIVATAIDQNVQNGIGETPQQYVVAVAAAKDAGLPALVVQSGDDVSQVVPDPQTTADVLEAVGP